MADSAANAERLVQAFNAKDFDVIASMIAPDLDFVHFDRDFTIQGRAGLLDVLRNFAANFIPDRRLEPPERVTVAGDIVVGDAKYAGTAAVNLPEFRGAGEAFRLKFCSVTRCDAAGAVIEWKDHG